MSRQLAWTPWGNTQEVLPSVQEPPTPSPCPVSTCRLGGHLLSARPGPALVEVSAHWPWSAWPGAEGRWPSSRRFPTLPSLPVHSSLLVLFH